MSDHALQIEDITKTFGTGHAAVDAVSSVSFTVEKGEIILIMGPSDSGKTTLLTMIGALLTPDSGRIIINDEDITESRAGKLWKFRLFNIGDRKSVV